MSSTRKRPVRSTKRAAAGNVSYDYDEPSSSGSDFSVKTKTPAKKGKAAEGPTAKTKTPAAKKVATTPDIVAAKKKVRKKRFDVHTPTGSSIH